MQLTKFGHSSVLLDDGHTKILFDPGIWTELPDISVDAIVVTHIHADHLGLEKHIGFFKTAPKIITQSEAKLVLDQQDIPCEVVEQGQTVSVNTLTLQAYGSNHAIIHSEMPQYKNTGYLVNGSIFHPGDSFTVPDSPVEILLLPLSAPWSKVSETMDYISAIKPKKIFGIHDAFLNETGQALYSQLAQGAAAKIGAEFIQPELNKAYEI